MLVYLCGCVKTEPCLSSLQNLPRAFLRFGGSAFRPLGQGLIDGFFQRQSKQFGDLGGRFMPLFIHGNVHSFSHACVRVCVKRK